MARNSGIQAVRRQRTTTEWRDSAGDPDYSETLWFSLPELLDLIGVKVPETHGVTISRVQDPADGSQLMIKVEPLKAKPPKVA